MNTELQRGQIECPLCKRNGEDSEVHRDYMGTGHYDDGTHTYGFYCERKHHFVVRFNAYGPLPYQGRRLVFMELNGQWEQVAEL